LNGPSLTREAEELESLEERITELNRELATIKEKLDNLNLEARKWAEKRNAVHEQIKKLQKEASGLKEKRDAINEMVRKLKGLREKAREKRKERHAKILSLKKELGTLMKKRPLKNMHEIQKEIETLEWKIQTTPLALNEEKSLINQVRPLEAQLLIHKQIQKLKEDIFELQMEQEKLDAEAKFHHEKLSDLAEQSQKSHGTRLEVLKRISDSKIEADIAHHKYVWTKQQAEDLRKKYVKFLHQIEALKQELRQAEEKKRAERQIELRKALEERALEKLRRGEKLTLEEFKVLSEKGIL